MKEAIIRFYKFSKFIILFMIFALLTRIYVFQPYIVDGQSMEPNLHNKDILVVERMSYYLHQPERGDIVIFYPPGTGRETYVKRIIGLPGEKIQITPNGVLVNDRRLPEEYLSSTAANRTFRDTNSPAGKPLVLKDDEYFLMGDNREHSSDSRNWGQIKKSAIVGKTELVALPRTSFHVLAAPDYDFPF